jgi:hypothetical protein
MNSCSVVGVVGRWLLLVVRYERLLLLGIVLKKNILFLPVRALLFSGTFHFGGQM